MKVLRISGTWPVAVASGHVAMLFAMIGARMGRYVFVFCPTASQLAANWQPLNLCPFLTRHRSTELRVVGIETRYTLSLMKEPTPESNDLTMSRVRIRERILSSFIGLAPTSLDV